MSHVNSSNNYTLIAWARRKARGRSIPTSAGFTLPTPKAWHYVFFSLFLGRVTAHLRGTLACSAASLMGCCAGRAQDHCCRQLEQGRICCVTLWQNWLGISRDATPLQLMLGFSSLLLSLSPTFPIPTGACTPPKDAPVYHLPYHKLEEHPVIIGQKFLVEATEHLRRGKGGLSSGRVTVLVPWVAHSLLAHPGHTCTSSLVHWAAHKGWGSTWVCAGASDGCRRMATALSSPALGMCI